MLARVPFNPQIDREPDAPHAHVWTIVLTGDAPPTPACRHDRPRRHRPGHWSPALSAASRSPRAQRTLERASRLAAPGRMVTVMTRQRAAAWERELEAVADGPRVVQPSYRGRAAELLLPLLKIVRHDPSATVILLPAVQPVEHDARFLRYVGRALWATALRPDVPLVIPEVNADDVEQHKGILAIPNCSTTPLVMPRAPTIGKPSSNTAVSFVSMPSICWPAWRPTPYDSVRVTTPGTSASTSPTRS